MIWLVMGIVVLGVMLYVTQPLYAKTVSVIKNDNEVSDYLQQIADIETRLKTADKSIDVSALERAKVELQRQILAKDIQVKDAGPQTILAGILFITIAIGSMGLYASLGRPDLSQTQEKHNPEPQDIRDLTLEQAVAKLEQKLAQGDQSAQGWMLYARSLMSLRRYDEAVAAYEKVLQVTDNNPQVLKELETAKAFINEKRAGIKPVSPLQNAQQRPSAQQIQAVAEMSPEDRQNMIKNMVEGLSQKLIENPDDLDGWTRLLRARKVLGQETEAQADIALMRETYKDNPKAIEKILTDTGWAED